ncbi:hypothetical protein BaRGS_00001838 [Batillaria attramentaria]|uniref:Uncharacterized protein n=1 Tax=Batillaria attramentaria TaxID=370345 RepID=A0ABD0M5R9_9CAEN
MIETASVRTSCPQVCHLQTHTTSDDRPTTIANSRMDTRIASVKACHPVKRVSVNKGAMGNHTVERQPNTRR